MNSITSALNNLYDRIPRRHSLENVKEMNDILTEYEDLLIKIEALNGFYEKEIPVYFEAIETVTDAVKKSTDNKASKKLKDQYFDVAADSLKDSMQELITFFADGKRTK